VIDPDEGVFLSRHTRICALCLGDIRPQDPCTYVDTEIACIPCSLSVQAENLDPYDELPLVCGCKECACGD
jgi:hypothetical protein